MRFLPIPPLSSWLFAFRVLFTVQAVERAFPETFSVAECPEKTQKVALFRVALAICSEKTIAPYLKQTAYDSAGCSIHFSFANCSESEIEQAFQCLSMRVRDVTM